jgi:KipI family sensor histidine kinase inhibitor
MEIDDCQMKDYGDAGILVDFPKLGTNAAWEKSHNLAYRLRQLGIPGILGIIPTYATIYISFDSLEVSRKFIKQELEKLLFTDPATSFQRSPQIFRIPVVFNKEHGPDLEFISENLKISEREVVDRFCSAPLRIMCVNRGPMFGSNFDESVPRLETPRTRVPAGAVTIGGNQTSIMTQESPGGWRILGQTPVHMDIDYDHNPPVPYNPGDIMEFFEIDRTAFHEYDGKRISDMKVN